jgi:hypothetical protein
LLGPDLVFVLNNALRKGILSRSQRKGIIVLLYKKGDSELLKNWRPISLLNIDYKIMTKVLSQRLRSVMPYIINEDQTGAVPGRSISYSIALTRDIIKYCNETDTPAAILSIDQTKAFDMVSWSFLFKALEKFGFGPEFISWVKLCYTDISSALKINGHLSEFFNLERGVRQGCCLSMGLYTIVSEYMAELIRNEPNIKGIMLPNNTECKLNQYVDDTQIYVLDIRSIFTTLSCFRLLRAATGAIVNLDKTEGLWLGPFKGRKDKPGDIKWTSDSIKVLGITVGNLDLSTINWTPRIDKFRCALNLWSQRDLSLYGKSVVVNVIASSKIWYHSNVIHMPDWVVKELSTLMINFIWSKRRHLVAKQAIHLPFEKGGLNIVNIADKITAQRIIWISKMLSCKHKCSILFNYFIGLYKQGLFNNDILHLDYTVNHYNCSAMPIIYKEYLKAWEKVDIQLENPPLRKCDILSEVLFMNTKITKANANTIWSDELVKSNNIRISDIWDKHSCDFVPYDEFCVEHLLTYTEKSKSMYKKIIECVPKTWKLLLKARTHDEVPSQKMYYVFVDNKKIYHHRFSCKIIYGMLLKISVPNSLCKWNRLFETELKPENIFNSMHKGINEKYELQLYWKFLHLSLPTKDFLVKCKITNDDICPFCHEKETNIHLFIDCHVAFNLWTKVEYLFNGLTEKQGKILDFYTVCFNFDHCRDVLSQNCILLCNYLLMTARLVLWRNRNLKLKGKFTGQNVYRLFVNTVVKRIKEEHRMANVNMCRRDKFINFWCTNGVLCTINDNFTLCIKIK